MNVGKKKTSVELQDILRDFVVFLCLARQVLRQFLEITHENNFRFLYFINVLAPHSTLHLRCSWNPSKILGFKFKLRCRMEWF